MVRIVILLGLVILTGNSCAQFGLPPLPREWRGAAGVEGDLFIVYDPDAVLGLGHTGLILAEPGGEGWVRYDQYASAEIDYVRRARRGEAGFAEGITARLPSIFGFTKELVIRRLGQNPGDLVGSWEYAVPVRIDPSLRARIHRAAETRYAEAATLEQAEARTYYLLTNNCQHFLRDLLRAGDLAEEHYFPKNLVWAYLERYVDRSGVTAP